MKNTYEKAFTVDKYFSLFDIEEWLDALNTQKPYTLLCEVERRRRTSKKIFKVLLENALKDNPDKALWKSKNGKIKFNFKNKRYFANNRECYFTDSEQAAIFYFLVFGDKIGRVVLYKLKKRFNFMETIEKREGSFGGDKNYESPKENLHEEDLPEVRTVWEKSDEECDADELMEKCWEENRYPPDARGE